MRVSLFWKLFAVQLVAAAVLIGGVLLVIRHQTATSFAAYVEARERQRMEDVAERIAERYAQRQDLRSAALAVRELRRRGDARAARKDEAHDDEHMHPRPLRAPLTLLDAQGAHVAGAVLPEVPGEPLRVAIRSGDAVIGYLVRPPLPAWAAPEEIGFRQRQSEILLRITALSLPLAALFALLISALILHPIRRLSAGTAALSRREFDTRIDVRRGDELGRLAADFNRLAETLGRYDTRQRQWLADIAHELRTPVAVLRGELDAMLDGVRSAEPARLRSLQQEVLRLHALIDDLHLLSLAESGGLRLQRERTDLATLLGAALARFDARLRAGGFAVTFAAPAQPLVAEVDAQRIEQVLGNLFQNLLQHARPGAVRVSLTPAPDGAAAVAIEDCGPGVPEAALARLFDRLYRVEAARSRSDGGAGLGLAICRSIVEAHGGRIEAQRSALGGLCIRFTLPAVATP